MAVGFRSNQQTQAGRKVKPSEKVRALMSESVWKTILELSDQLEQCEVKLSRAFHDGRSVPVIKALRESWRELFDDLRDATDEYGQLATPEEYAAQEDSITQCIRLHQEFELEIRRHLEKQQEPRRVKSQVDVNAESRRLATEIRRVEEQISQVSKGSKPGATYVTWSPTTSAPGTRTPGTANSNTRFQPPRHSSPYPDQRTRQLVDTPQPVSPTTGVLEKLAGLLTNKREHLPKLEPEVFSGNILEFPAWLSSFESLVEQHADNDKEKLFYLGKYTAGDAKQSISGFLTLRSDDAFERAKSLLSSRFGDKVMVSRAYRNKLFNWPNIKKDDGVALRKYADFLWQCSAAMDSVCHLESLNTAEENAKIVKVLPRYLVEKWMREVDRWYYHSDPIEGGLTDGDGACCDDRTDSFPPFINLCRLVSREARIQNGPISHLLGGDKAAGQTSTVSGSDKPSRRSRAFASASTSTKPVDENPSMNSSRPPAPAAKSEPKPPPKCFFCREEHYLSRCPEFGKKSGRERREYAEENKLCFGCLGKGHAYRTCRIRIAGLFADEPVEPPQKQGKVFATHGDTHLLPEKPAYFSMIVPVTVSHVSAPGRSVRVNALLDTQSDSTFITEDLLDQLGAANEKVDLSLVTMGARHEVVSRVVKNLLIRGEFEKEGMMVRECFTRAAIPASDDQLPDPEVAAAWPHLRDLQDVLLPKSEGLPIGMLIGHDCPGALLTIDQRYIGDQYPVGIRTRLGWSFMGPRHAPSPGERACFSTSARVVSVKEVALAFDSDFVELSPSEEKISQDDRRFLRIAEESIHVRPDGHMEMDLPFRCDEVTVPDNYDVARSRLQSLGRRMTRDDEFADQYRKFMSKLIADGHAALAPETKVEGKYQYMPHHGVSHPRKPGEIRGVFDGSSEKNGVSLNQLLLPGPDLTNNLLGVLCNFRREKIAFMCDVRGMFLQVFVSEEHRDYMRFLWFRDGDPSQEVLEYRMLVHTFGASSSPGCVNFAFKRLATIHADEYDPEVIEFIRRHFYVDDGLKSEATVDDVVRLFTESHRLCASGGFLLHKFTCSSDEVIERIPQELLAKSVREFNLDPRSRGIETSLGMTWDRVADCFLFIVCEFKKRCTRRGMLSALSGVYDPIGLISPVILIGRQLLQELCNKGANWDDTLETEYVERWFRWYRQLQMLCDLRIPRCLRRTCELEGLEVEFHHFSDASTCGLGACSYIRMEDARGNVDVALVLGKAKVPPKKSVTIPRMELQAALLTAKQANFLKREMPYPEATHWFWSDSRVVLGYLRNTTRRFHLFVANRVQQIHDLTERSHWNHVATQDNPADLASRGCLATELIASENWWRGPSFLRVRRGEECDEDFTVADDDPEVKRPPMTSLKTVTEPSWLDRVSGTISSWPKLRKFVAVYQRYVRYLRDRVDGLSADELRQRCGGPIEVADLRASCARIVCIMQRESLMHEVLALKDVTPPGEERGVMRSRKMELRKNSSLHRLDAFIDDHHVMRVGGRLRCAHLRWEEAHPMILPQSHAVTSMIVRHAHARVHH